MHDKSGRTNFIGSLMNHESVGGGDAQSLHVLYTWLAQMNFKSLEKEYGKYKQ